MNLIKIEEALKLKDVVFVDVRTEKEYEEDFILNAQNLPLFKTEEHSVVGTIYKNDGKEEAIKKGFDFVSYKLKDFYESFLKLSKEYENIVIYCARGGMRSGSIYNLISSIGIKVFKLEGGYKSYRNYVINYLENVSQNKEFIVLHGLTGVGKTDLLKELDKREIDNIDLETIAKNSGSTFGFVGFDEKPPTQKRFESEIFYRIFYSKGKYIFIESESKRVGHVLIPNNLYEHLVNSKNHLIVTDNLKNRVERLSRDYLCVDNLVLEECINKFRKRIGNEKVDEYIGLLKSDKTKLIENYLVEYYDPLYNHSVKKYSYKDEIDFSNIENGISKVIEFKNSLENN